MTTVGLRVYQDGMGDGNSVNVMVAMETQAISSIRLD